jgi:hypothetical protein
VIILPHGGYILTHLIHYLFIIYFRVNPQIAEPILAEPIFTEPVIDTVTEKMVVINTLRDNIYAKKIEIVEQTTIIKKEPIIRKKPIIKEEPIIKMEIEEPSILSVYKTCYHEGKMYKYDDEGIMYDLHYKSVGKMSISLNK